MRRSCVWALALGLAGALSAGVARPARAAGGTVGGTVKWTGAPAPRPPLKVVKDSSVCGAEKPDETLVVGRAGGLANVVVAVRGAKSAGPPPAPARATLDQQGCRYVPHVQAVTQGSEVALVNSDAILHNVHGNVGPIQAFNVAMPIKGQRLPTRLTRPGVVRLQCDAGHTWMTAYIHVLEHPLFAVTDADGKFEIKDVPPGRYTLEYWHEARDGKSPGVVKTAEVTVKDGGPTRADLTLAE